MKILLLDTTQKNNKVSFWGKQEIFFHNVEFDEQKSIEYLHVLNLNEDEKCLFLEEFIKFYQQYKINDYYQEWFNKSLNLIHKVYGLDSKSVYKYTLNQISDFEKKEDIEIFYYFKQFSFLHEGESNIFSDLLNWFTENQETINNLLQKTIDNKPNHVVINGYYISAGVSGKGKSLFLKKKLLQKNVIIISKKEFNLTSFKEEDKDYFYSVFINLTKEKDLHSFYLKLKKDKNKSIFSEVANYIEKKLYYEYLNNKFTTKNRENITLNTKKLKI